MEELPKAERLRLAQIAASKDQVAQRHASDFVGMTHQEARQFAGRTGVTLRLISLDESGWGTSAYVYGRVTAYTRHGVVTDAQAG